VLDGVTGDIVILAVAIEYERAVKDDKPDALGCQQPKSRWDG